MKDQGTKFDQGKVPMDLLDPEWLVGVAKILQFGAQKYAAHNWRKGMLWSRLYAASQRHLNAFAQGEETDSETGLSHLLHASCCLMFLYSMQQNRPELNDLFWATGGEPEPDENAARPNWTALADGLQVDLVNIKSRMAVFEKMTELDSFMEDTLGPNWEEQSTDALFLATFMGLDKQKAVNGSND